MQSKISITKRMSIIGAFAACVIAIAIPSLYYAFSINETQQILTTEAVFFAKSVEKMIQTRPDLWEYEVVRLKETISQPSTHGEKDEREIRNVAEKLVTNSDVTETRPVISVSAPLFDSGRLVGSITIRHSIRRQIITTALLGILSSLFGCLIYFIFRTYPIRKLENTLIDLQQERDKSNKTLYAIGDGVISVDPKGKILLMNRIAESLVGMDTSEAVGRQLKEVYVLRQNQENQVGEKEFILTGKGGIECAIEEVRTPLTEMESDESGFVVVFRDITERKRTKESLQRAHDELEQRVADRTEELIRVNEELRTEIIDRKRADEEKDALQAQLLQAQKMESVGRLAGGVAHDFNNKLSVILGFAELALNKVTPSQSIHADLEEIRNAASQSADLTRQLLAFARKQTICPKVLDLNETVEGMLKMLLRLIGEDIDLAWLPAKDLWLVMADPSQIDQIMANLCVNARDAISGVGKMTIETGNRIFDEEYCTAHPGSLPGEYVVLNVSDSGCGMNKETQLHIFEPFYTTKEMGKGTGLGLATVYGIVKQNNGYINVYSEQEQGTTFSIYLPRHIGKSEQTQKEDPSEPAVHGNETILLVEDEPEVLKMTRTMLEKIGYTVLAAPTTGEAIRLAESHTDHIHLVMTDVIMPSMNGRDLVRNLLTSHPNFRSLFMSGYTANIIAHQGMLDPGVNFIQKPFSIKKLAAKIREVLDEPKGSTP